MADDDKTLAETQATRLKFLAETTYDTYPNSPPHLKSSLKYATKAHNLYPSLPGLSSLLTAFKILHSISTTSNKTHDYYSVLGLPPFSPLNSIKTQFKKLALLLHPDKTRSASHAACDEAFKVVNDAFRVLSDRGLRREYDTRMRMALQSELEGGKVEEGEEEEEEDVRLMFWTVCEGCDLMHKFERKDVGRSVICPNCDAGFIAYEVSDDRSIPKSGKSERRKGGFGGKLVSNEGIDRGKLKRNEKKSDRVSEGSLKNVGRKGDFSGKFVDCEGSDMEVVLGKLRRNERKIVKGNEGSLRNEDTERVSGGQFADSGGNDMEVGRGVLGKKDRIDRVNEGSLTNVSLEGDKEVVDQGKSGNEVRRSTRVRVRNKYFWDNLGENVLTSQENDEGKSEVDDRKVINNGKKDGLYEERSRNGVRKRGRLESVEVEEEGESELTLAEMRLTTMKKMKGKKKEGNRVKIRDENEEVKKGRRLRAVTNGGDMEIMPVEDSEFNDFDEDRVEKCFKKSQIWAIYDDDDGMPRHYGLIDEVVSFNPFEVKMRWLDLDSHGDDHLITCEKIGFRVSCGRFKVSQKDTINLLNIFSHLVECERAARELYRIYPKKGSVWALYHEQEQGEGGNSLGRDRRQYDIVVLLTSYSEMHGLSMAYLEKVDGFRVVFKRREIGIHAIQWLEKDGIKSFSHQIPAKKLSTNDIPDLLCDCWELDPAALPSSLLAITKE